MLTYFSLSLNHFQRGLLRKQETRFIHNFLNRHHFLGNPRRGGPGKWGKLWPHCLIFLVSIPPKALLSTRALLRCSCSVLSPSDHHLTGSLEKQWTGHWLSNGRKTCCAYWLGCPFDKWTRMGTYLLTYEIIPCVYLSRNPNSSEWQVRSINQQMWIEK